MNKVTKIFTEKLLIVVLFLLSLFCFSVSYLFYYVFNFGKSLFYSKGHSWCNDLFGDLFMICPGDSMPSPIPNPIYQHFLLLGQSLLIIVIIWSIFILIKRKK
jgi:hypothetical protein